MKDELFEAYRELQSERLLLREITEQDVDDVFEGTLRKHEMCRGDFVDIQMFSLLREDMNL